MASLHPPPALAAPTNLDVESAHQGAPHNLFLILCFAAFRLHAAAAMRAAFGQWNHDSFIHPRRDGTARLTSIVATRFAARALRVGIWVAARMGRCLTFAGAQRCFQFPSQAFGFLLQPL